MKFGNKLRVVLPILLILLSFTACSSGTKRYELSNLIGKSISSFEHKSAIKTKKQSNGVYLKEGIVQVIAPDKKVTSITLLDNPGKYTVFGVTIGMNKSDADPLLQVVFGKETSKTINEDKHATIYTYLKDDRALYIWYDVDSKKVTNLSYYKVDAQDLGSKDEATPATTGELMLMVGDIKVYYSEAMLYLLTATDRYEGEYGKSIWKADVSGNGKSFGNMIKDEIINQICELKIIHAKAQELKITLMEEEQSQANSYAKERFEKMSDKEKQSYMITQELLQQMYADHLLADKMFEMKTINVNTDVSDVLAKQITVQDIFIKNYNLDSSGHKVALSTEDKAAAELKVQSLLQQAKNTDDFRAIALANTQAEKVEYTFGNNSVPKEFSDVLKQEAFALKTGKISNIIETADGWHILYCVSDFNSDATLQAKESIIDQRRSDMFVKLYKEWSTGYEFVVNHEAWESIPLGE